LESSAPTNSITSTVSSLTSVATPSNLPPAPSGLTYFITSDGTIFLTNTSVTERKLAKRDTTATFEDCLNECAVDPSCTEAIWSTSDSTCTLSVTAICSNPPPAADSEVGYKVGTNTSSVAIPSCINGGRCGSQFSNAIWYAHGPCLFGCLN
jgi:hypothetical protein